MIELDENLLIGRGSHRETYRHPEKEGLCLKVLIPGKLELRRSRNKKWYKRLRRLSQFDETNKELEAYKRMGKLQIPMTHFPKFYGMVETSRGRGMLLDLIENEDGTAVRSLKQHLASAADCSIYTKPLEELAQYLMDNAVVIRDFSIGDLLVKEFGDGQLRVYVVDGFGGYTMIPLTRCRAFARLAVKRRVKRLFRVITNQYPTVSLSR
ncbi:MAG: YrbL family protein [Pontiella sp.]